MYTHVSKCKNDKIKEEEEKKEQYQYNVPMSKGLDSKIYAPPPVLCLKGANVPVLLCCGSARLLQHCSHVPRRKVQGRANSRQDWIRG
jgi:hypothetical protein